jgi:cell division inhibitor SepF
MSFWDNVKKFAQPYADEDYDDYDEEELDEFEEEVAPAPRERRRAPAFGSAPASESADFTPAAPAAPAATERPSGFGGQILSMSNGSKQEVVLFHAKAFDDAAKAADELRNRRAVILNMENVDKALTRRVVDFLSGCVYALDGQVKKIAQSTYLFCPHSMDIVGDLESFQAQAESYI